MQRSLLQETTIDETERKQDEFSAVIDALKNYALRDNIYVEAKNKLLNNAKNVYIGREKIIEGFKNRVFPFYYDKDYEYQMKVERQVVEEEQKNKMKKQLMRINLMIGLIRKKQK